MQTRRHFVVAAVAGAAIMLGGPAVSQPKNTLRLIVGGPAGGAPDVAARLAADQLKELGYVAIVENHAGAGGRLGVEALRQSAADGSTALVTPPGVFTIYPHIYPDLPYEASDFVGVSTLAGYQFGLAVGPAAPVSTMDEFLEWARQNPDLASYGSPGAGSEPHFIGAEIDRLSNTPLTHVPYRGGAQAINDLTGGHLAAMVTALPNLLAQQNADKIKVLAMTGEQRNPLAPDVPTMAEAGMPELTSNLFYGVYVPADVPEATQQALATAFAQVGQSVAYREGLARMSLDSLTLSPDELASTMDDMSRKWATVVERSGFTIDR